MSSVSSVHDSILIYPYQYAHLPSICCHSIVDSRWCSDHVQHFGFLGCAVIIETRFKTLFSLVVEEILKCLLVFPFIDIFLSLYVIFPTLLSKVPAVYPCWLHWSIYSVHIFTENYIYKSICTTSDIPRAICASSFSVVSSS